MIVEKNDRNNNNDAILDIIKDSSGAPYLFELLEQEPCINWVDFASKIYRHSHSVNSIITYVRGIHFFKAYLNAKELTICKLLDNSTQEEILKVVDDFVTVCDVKGLKARTIESYLIGVRKLFRFTGIKIDSEDFKEHVVVPRKLSLKDEIPTNEQIRKILNYASPRVRTYLMVLCDSGLSMGDALKLRVKDFKFEEDLVKIATFRSKTGALFETFVTNETGEEIKQIIENKNLKPDNYVFVRVNGKRAADNMRVQYTQVLKKAGLDDKVENHRYYKFHLHVFRKRWFSKAINVVPAYVAHAMLGRKQYLDEYLRLPEEQRRVMYKKIAKEVSVFESKKDRAEVVAEASKLLGIELTEEKITALKGLMQEFMTLGNKDLRRLKKKMRKGR